MLNKLTKSKADPPPKYSIMIHNFVPCAKRETGFTLGKFKVQQKIQGATNPFFI